MDFLGDFGNLECAIEANELEIMSVNDSLLIRPPLILAFVTAKDCSYSPGPGDSYLFSSRLYPIVKLLPFSYLLL